MGVICVNVFAHDQTPRGDAEGRGASCARARSVEGCDGAVAGAHEAMIDRVTVVEGPCDRLRRVDAGRERPYAAGRISRRVECGKGAVAGPDEDPVITAERVSRDEREIGSAKP